MQILYNKSNIEFDNNENISSGFVHKVPNIILELNTGPKESGLRANISAIVIRFSEVRHCST